MPLIIPIQDAPEFVASIGGVFAGNTDMAGSLSVGFNLKGNLAGSTQAHAEFGALYGALVGSTSLVGFLRIGAEANVFMAGALTGETAFDGSFNSLIAGDSVFAGATAMAGELSVLTLDEPSFMIAVDILDTGIATQGNIRRYGAKLLADGVEVPIRRATLEASPETLGTELRVTLARPDVALVTLAASIEFRIGLWVNGSPGSFNWITMMQGGKLSSRGNALKNDSGMPSDEVTLSIVDVVADRWNRAPRAPVHMYDPDLSPTPSADSMANGRIEILGGGFIAPVNEAVLGMRLRNVMIRAYVTGCGFSSVVSNIPNFPVKEADFSLDGGWDGGVRPLLSLFQPVLFERENVLYVIDPDAPLPAGMSARDFTHAQTKEIRDSLPQREPVNSLLLRLSSAGGGEYYTERLETKTDSQGVFGTEGYTETDMERRIREYRNFAQPTAIVREEIVYDKTTVLDHEFNTIEVTTETSRFDAYNRKTGATKKTSCRIPDPANDGVLTFMADVTVQEQAITYVTDPTDPTRDLQDRVTTVLSGLVLEDEDNQYLDKPYRIPVLDAHRSGYIDPSGSQTLLHADIRTTIEQLRVRGQQVDVETRVIDHVSDVPTRNATTTRPATADLSRKAQTSQRQILLTIPGTDSVARRAQTLDAGELPYDIAIQLGQRRLARLNQPAREVQAVPGYVDVTLRRGTVLSLKKRNASELGVYIVRGTTIDIEAYGQGEGIRATMSVTARELLT